MSLIEDRVSCEQALNLSRIEENLQIKQNGKIEGEHDFDESTIFLNISAAKLFDKLAHLHE